MGRFGANPAEFFRNKTPCILHDSRKSRIPAEHRAYGFRPASISFNHSISHADLGEDILRLGGVLFNLAADIRHIHA